MPKITGPKQPPVQTPETAQKAQPKASKATARKTTAQTQALDTRDASAHAQAPQASPVPKPALQHPQARKKKAVAGPPAFQENDLRARAQSMVQAYVKLPPAQQEAVQGVFSALSRALDTGPRDLKTTAETMANAFDGLSKAEQGPVRDVMGAFFAALDAF